MDITCTLNTRDFSTRLAKYKLRKVVEPGKLVKTLDGTEHVVSKTRDELTIRLIPSSESTATSDYTALSALVFSATYTDPYITVNNSHSVTKTLRVVSDLDAVFGLKSVDGNRYYKGGDIVLRATTCN